MKKTKVLIAGAGAIGSMVAWQLHRAARAEGSEGKLSVSILAGGDRLARYRKDGFVINGERIDFELAEAGAGFADGAPGHADLVIIACKNHHLDAVISDLAGYVGPDTLILSLLNGISSEETIARAFGPEKIPYAMIIGTDAGHAGNVTTFAATGKIFFGDRINSADRRNWSPRVARIAEILEEAGIAYVVPEDMLNRLWYKYMLNVGVNQLTAITRRPYRAIQTDTMLDETKELLDGAMREVIALAKTEGIALGDDDIESVYRTMDGLDPEGKTSMCQDVEAGRKTEVELFSGTVIRLAGERGIPVPINELFWKLIRTIETSY